MSARNIGSSDQALLALLRDMKERIGRLERRRWAGEGTGSGSGECDCEDGHSITVYEQEDEPVGPSIGDIWITEE